MYNYINFVLSLVLIKLLHLKVLFFSVLFKLYFNFLNSLQIKKKKKKFSEQICILIKYCNKI